MRVVAGKYGSRPLKAVPGMNTRPTTDKIKESIFNMLGGMMQGQVVLDFYGGSGALAIEAVSRGAVKAIICEKHRPAIQTIYQNIDMTKESHYFEVLAGDNYRSLQAFVSSHPNVTFDTVLLDPPYKTQKIIEDIEWLEDLQCLSQDCTIMCETDHHTDLPLQISDFTCIKDKTYGQTTVRIYERGNL